MCPSNCVSVCVYRSVTQLPHKIFLPIQRILRSQGGIAVHINHGSRGGNYSVLINVGGNKCSFVYAPKLQLRACYPNVSVMQLNSVE